MTDPNEFRSTNPSDRLEAYLDGLLTPEQRLAFEKELQADEQLRREVDLQQQVDVSLQRMYTAPAPLPEDLALVENEATSRGLAQLPIRRVDRGKGVRLALVATAAIVVWAMVGWMVYRGSTDDGYRQFALEDIYQRRVADGFQPDWVCEDDREFAGTFRRRQGQALLLNPIPQGEMVGLAYLKGMTHNTTAMLARVEGDAVIVFVESLQHDTHPAEPSWSSGLHLFRKELSGLVLYEISPLAEPRVLNHFYVPEQALLPQSDTEEQADVEAKKSANSL